MKLPIEKMKKIEEELALENSQFTLFAFFLREDFPFKWDMIVSAEWIDNNKRLALEKISAKLAEQLERNEQLMISKIVILQHDHPELHELDRFNFAGSSQLIEVRNENLLGQDIKQAFFIPLKKAA